MNGCEASLGAQDRLTLSSFNNLATLLYAQGKLGEAEEFCRRALMGREAVLGSQHPDTLRSFNNMALLLQDQGKLSEAEELYRKALTGREAVLGPPPIFEQYGRAPREATQAR